MIVNIFIEIVIHDVLEPSSSVSVCSLVVENEVLLDLTLVDLVIVELQGSIIANLHAIADEFFT